MYIRPAAGCKYFLTIRPALLFCTPNRFISGQGRCPGRLCHVQDVRVRPGRICHVPNVRVRPGRLCHVPNVRVHPGRLCHVPNVRVRPGRLCYVLDVRVRVRVWYRFWFHYGIKHSCYRFKYVITSNIWCAAAWSDGYSTGL